MPKGPLTADALPYVLHCTAAPRVTATHRIRCERAFNRDRALHSEEIDLLYIVVQRERYLTLLFIAAFFFVPAMTVINGVIIYMVRRLRPIDSHVLFDYCLV